MSIARALSKLGALITSGGKVPTAGIDDSAVTAGKIAAGAALSNLGFTPLNKAGDTMTGALTLTDGVAASRTALFNNTTYSETETNRTLGYSTGWTGHLSVSITLARRGPVFVHAQFANFYESGAVRGQARITVSNGSLSYEYDVGQQGTANMAMGSHTLSHVFGDMPIGTWTVTLDTRNIGSGSNWILNNFIGKDGLYVMY